MSYSDLVATIALVVSVLTAGWTILRVWRWDRPVVSVAGEQWIAGLNSSPVRHSGWFTVEVVNTGNQSTQIIDAYWEMDRGNGAPIKYVATHGGGGVESLFQSPVDSKIPAIPFALARYERRTWDFDIDLTGIQEPEGIVRARPVVQFTSRKKTEFAYGDWKPSHIAIWAKREREKAGR